MGVNSELDMVGLIVHLREPPRACHPVAQRSRTAMAPVKLDPGQAPVLD